MKRLVVIVSVLAGIAAGVRFVVIPRAHAVVPFFDGTTSYYYIDGYSAVIHRIDPADFSDASPATQSITTDTGQTKWNNLVVGTAAVHPTSGVVYAVLGLNASGLFPRSRYLTTLNIETGVAHVIGDLGDNFSALAFGSDGTLYGLTGDGATVPSSLYSINIETGAKTLLASYTANFDGESLTFNPNTGLLYRVTGKDGFSIDPNDPTNPVSLFTGSSDIPANSTALFYDSNTDKYYECGNNTNCYDLNISNGAATLLGGVSGGAIKGIIRYPVTVLPVTFSPTDNEVNVPADQQLTLQLSETVTAGTGNIVVHKASDNSSVQTIDVTSGAVTGWGTDTLTITPSSDLPFDTELYVTIDSGAVVGTLPFEISDPREWSFTTRPSGTTASFTGDFTSVMRFDPTSTAHFNATLHQVALPPQWHQMNGTTLGYDNISNNIGGSPYPFVAKLPNGNPIVAWNDDTSYSYSEYRILVSQWNGSAWTHMDGVTPGYETISNPASISGDPIIAVMASGTPIIVFQSYRSGSVSDIYVTKWNGSSWTRMDGVTPGYDNISNNAGNSIRASVALTPAGRPVVAWWDATPGGTSNYEVLVSEWNGSAWTRMDGSTPGYDNVSNNSGSFGMFMTYIGIRITSGGIPIIAWSDAPIADHEIFISEWNGSAWTGMDGSTPGADNISNNSGDSLYPQLDLTSSDRPVVVWQDATTGVDDIYVSEWNGSAWTGMDGSTPGYDNISNSAGDSYFPWFALTSSDRPIVVWTDNTTGTHSIYVSKWNGSAWTGMDGATPGYDNISNGVRSDNGQIALTAADNPIISWYGAGISASQWNGSAWTGMDGTTPGYDVVANPGRQSFTYYRTSAIIITPTGNPIVVWYDTAGVGFNYDVFVSKWIPYGSVTVQSPKVNGLATGITAATLTATETTPGASTIDYSLSDDGGSTWESVSTGVPHTFAAPGDDLRWRAVLTAGSLPLLTGIDLSYTIPAPPTPSPTPSASGGSACSGTVSVAVSVSGGSASPVDAALFLDGAGMSRDSTYTLSCGTHIVSATALSGYTHTWSGDCASDGSVSIDRGTARTCSALFTYGTQSGVASSPTPTPSPSVSVTPAPSGAGSLSAAHLHEGDTVSAVGSNDPDVYIVNVYGYKRLFLNPVIFSFYGHLGGFAKVKTITPTVRDSFGTSGLFRNCETNDQAVYGVETTGEDTGILHHINITGDAAVAQDPDFFKKVFCINTREFDWYTTGSDYTSLSQVPRYQR